MATNKWSTKHVATLSDLPQILEKGRAYFIDDEHYIIIDHGSGPVIYGNRTGAQGQAGEPIPILQNQIDSLTNAAFNTAFWVDSINNTRRKAEAALQDNITNSESLLRALVALKEQESISRENELLTHSNEQDEKLQADIIARENNLQSALQTIDTRHFENYSTVMQQLELCAQAIISLTQITSTLCDNLKGTEATILNLILQNEAQNSVTPFSQQAVITTEDGYSFDVVQGADDNTLIINLKS